MDIVTRQYHGCFADFLVETVPTSWLSVYMYSLQLRANCNQFLVIFCKPSLKSLPNFFQIEIKTMCINNHFKSFSALAKRVLIIPDIHVMFPLM